jgi:hypothetical protein
MNRARVRVFSGDGQTDLGLGWYVDNVTTYAFRDLRTGSLRSAPNAEEPPSDELTLDMELHGWELDVLPDNPKIELDGGETVYGCQVWWSRVPEEKEDHDEQPWPAWADFGY